jgi:hypothetical protein
MDEIAKEVTTEYFDFKSILQFTCFGNNVQLSEYYYKNKLFESLQFNVDTNIKLIDKNNIEREFNVKIKSGELIRYDPTIDKTGKHFGYMYDLDILIDDCEITDELSNNATVRKLISIAAVDTFKPVLEILKNNSTSKSLELEDKLKHFPNY